MLFSRIPRPGQLLELVVIFVLCWWVFHNPAAAGHFVSGILHFLTVTLPNAVTVFFQSM